VRASSRQPSSRGDLLAQRRLGDVQPRGRAPEVQLLGDGHEVAQLTQLHPHIIADRANESINRYSILDKITRRA
jgi:hypothetical protein